MFHDFREAPCVDHFDLFQGIIQHTGADRVRQAKAICARCPSADRAACLTLGYEDDGTPAPGVYGGLSQAERPPRS